MGLVSKIKGLFKKKELSINEKSENKLITIANPSGIIKIGESLVVAEGYVAIIVTKGKVCDIFSKGEYKLETGFIQKASKVRKLAKPDKKGNFVKKFKGFIYFVNLKEFENLSFESYNGIICKEKKLFTTSILIYGKYSCKIFNPQKFLNAMIKEFYNINDELTTKQLALWVGESVDKFVEHKKLSFKYFYLKDYETITDGLFDYIQKMFKDIGVEITNITIDKFDYNKNINKKIEQGKLFINDVAPAPEIPQETKEREEALKEIVENGENQNVIPNLEIDKTLNSNLEEYKETLYEEVGIPYEINEFDNKLNDMDNNVIIENENASETKFDFEKDIEENQENNGNEIEDADIIIGQSVKYKPCTNCGAQNTISAYSCYNCGIKFKKVCNICGAEMDEGSYVCPKCKAVNI